MSDLEFHLLDLDSKGEILFTQGAFVESCKYHNSKVVLYSLFTFWVEVYYDPENNTIRNIQLAGPQEMNKYLNQINIDLKK